jgi:hypothetical protein
MLVGVKLADLSILAPVARHKRKTQGAVRPKVLN